MATTFTPRVVSKATHAAANAGVAGRASTTGQVVVGAEAETGITGGFGTASAQIRVGHSTQDLGFEGALAAAGGLNGEMSSKSSAGKAKSVRVDATADAFGSVEVTGKAKAAVNVGSGE